MKRRISYAEALKGHCFQSYSEEAAFILERIGSGSLVPIKSSGKNGKKPALYNRYWEVSGDRDYGDLKEELLFRLNPAIDSSFYERHIDIYEAERPFVLALNRYISEREKELDIAFSENERSFAIWGREKFLSGRAEGKVSCARLLKHCGIEREFLNVYGTTEPLAFYARHRETPQNMLVLENLDSFYSMRKALIGGGHSIQGAEIGTLIYGGGKRVVSAFEDFELLSEPYMRDADNEILYFGDLDYEGIGIFEAFYARFGERLRIKPHVALYERMLGRAAEKGRDFLPKMKDGQGAREGELFFPFFEGRFKDTVTGLLKCGRYIPQEILNFMDY